MNKQIKVINNTKPKVRFFSKIICTTVCVYKFYNSYHSVYYVGQTFDARARFFDHSADLERNVHYSSEFQKDYNEIKKEGLDPHKYIKLDIVYSKSIYLEPNPAEMAEIISILRTKEKQLIKQLREQGKTLYNKPEGGNTNVKRPVVFKDPLNSYEIYYESVTACTKDLYGPPHLNGGAQKKIFQNINC